LRAKKAAASLFWISPTPLLQIEAALTQHGGAFDGAAGAVRSVASRTSDLLPAVAHVAELIHPELELSERVSRLLVRLELGVPAGIVDLARYTGTALTRSDYHDLLQAGLNTADAIEAAADSDILRQIGGDEEKLQVVRAAAAATRRGPEENTPTPLPAYEAK
jgi:helicase